MISGSLKDSLLGLKSQLESLEKELGPNEDSNTQKKDKKEVVKKFHNTDEKINELLQTEKTIRLNIGGKVFLTKTSTLLAFENSLFAKTLQAEGVNTKELFFDRSYLHFQKILDFLRGEKLTLKKMTKFEREDLNEEMEYYGLSELVNISKKSEFDVKWDRTLSKQGQFTVDSEDEKRINIHSTGCYTHFVTDKIWQKENFVIELESEVQQIDSYLYYGIVNDSYSYTGNCMCCSPANAFYVQCNGSIKVNSVSTQHDEFAFQSAKTTIGMRVYLENKTIQFYIPDKYESPVFPITGNSFRVVSGHCNTGNGSITISTCYEL